MKKLLLFIAFLGMLSIANAQTYTISFAATGAATTVDSVLVENLTHPATVKWHAGDVLQLVLSSGINESDIHNGYLKVIPNPMQGQAEISFYTEQEGAATISIYDIAGKEVLQSDDNYSKGIQKYQLTGLKQGLYFISIKSDGYWHTAKLISQNTTSGEVKIKFIGSEKPETADYHPKSTKATINMPYITGDNLRFTGYAGNLTTIVNDVPTCSITITFTFIAFPTLTTTNISLITSTSATSGGNITNDGGTAITERGVCWNTLPNPVITGSHTSDGTGIGSFTSNITGLTDNTIYYVRAYASNSYVTAYGNEVSFTATSTFVCGTNTVTDIDGNVYNTLQIGNQCWLKENLKTTHYRNGDPIPNVTDSIIWKGLSTGAYCDYKNNPAYSVNWGCLYNWYAVDDSCNMAPVGWHVPSDAEWTILKNYLTNNGYGYGGSGTDIAKSMAATTGWAYYGTPGCVGNDQASNNSSGFTGLPNGYRYVYQNYPVMFGDIDKQTVWYSATEYSTNSAWRWMLDCTWPTIDRYYESKKCGFSVRCVKD